VDEREKDINYYLSIKRSILFSMIFVPLIPFILVIISGYYYFTNSLESSTIARMTRIVENHRQIIELFLQERTSDLQLIAASYSFDRLSRPEVLHEVFQNLQQASNAFVDLGVFNQEGVHVAYHGPYKLAGKDYREAAWFKEVMEKGVYVSDIFLGYRKVPHFIIALVKHDNGTTWVLRATIDTLLFNDLVEGVRIGKTGEAYIVNQEGLFQTKRRSGGDLLDTDSGFNMYPAPSRTITTFVAEEGGAGESFLYAVAGLKENNWLLVVRQEKYDAFRALYSATYLVVIITVLGGLLMVPLAFIVSNRIVRKMEQLDAEKKQLNQQLVMASRLAEIGEMSAGFAHEINNPLQIIRNEQTMIETILADLKERGDLKPSEDLTELEDSVKQITVQIGRCAKITQAILKFARRKEATTAVIDLRAFLPEVIDMITGKARAEGVSIHKNISEGAPPVSGDPAELQQVLVNLLNNGIDAVVARHGSQGGELTVTVSAVDESAEIVITDNGCGISEDNMKKIFTPFFTTKPVGKGTGLGLSVCFGIIDRMGGTIDIQSKLHIGTRVTIRLPAEA